MKKIIIIAMCCISIMHCFTSRADTTVSYTIKSSGFWGFDGRNVLTCFPHPQSYCYEINVVATRANDIKLDGGYTNDGSNYWVNVTDNFSIYNTGTGTPQITLTIFDGTNNGQGSQYSINQLSQIAGDDQNPATFTYQ